MCAGVVKLDLRGFFMSLDHELLLLCVNEKLKEFYKRGVVRKHKGEASNMMVKKESKNVILVEKGLAF